MNLKQEIALITGVSSGIGLALATELLEKGTKVIGWSRSEVDIKNENFIHQKVDVTKSDQIAIALAELEQKELIPSILINNAGLGIFKLMEDLTEEEWKNMFDVNVHGIFNVTKPLIPHFKKNNKGYIVNIASIAALGGIAEATAYCGTKFAVRGISDAMYKELRTSNVRVTCVYPGSVNTNFFEQYPAVKANETMLNPKEVADSIINVLEKSDNFVTLNLEIRPLNPKYS